MNNLQKTPANNTSAQTVSTGDITQKGVPCRSVNDYLKTPFGYIKNSKIDSVKSVKTGVMLLDKDDGMLLWLPTETPENNTELRTSLESYIFEGAAVNWGLFTATK